MSTPCRTCILLQLVLSISMASAQTLTVATVNVWSGLTYDGSFSVDSYEDDADRAGRFDALMSGLRKAGPDVIALQEVNPVGTLARSIAEHLGYDVITQRVLAGIKIGPVGVPWNLNEGLAILARPGLELEFVDVVPLSSDFGAFGDVLSFHLGEQNAALLGAIRTGSGARVLVVNTHLPSNPEDSPRTRQRLLEICRTRGMNSMETSRWLDRLAASHQVRSDMIDRLLDVLDSDHPGDPILLLGDLNLPDGADDIVRIGTRRGYTDVSVTEVGALPTWDVRSNSLAQNSIKGIPTAGDPIEQLSREIDATPRTLDHIFVRLPIERHRIQRVERILDEPVGGTLASDHFGRMVTIELSGLRQTRAYDVSTIDFLPIMSYDDDVGFGYGVKAFFLDQLGLQESFDVIAFNSTKGERWYRIVFSAPDFELRQGSAYDLAIDVTLDYDKYLQNAFFGLGPNAQVQDKELYTKQLAEAQVLFARGISRHHVAQAGFRYRWIRNSNFADSSAIPRLATPLSAGSATALSLLVSFRHDTRNSYINPSRGIVLQGDVEFAPAVGNLSFLQVGGAVQVYTTLMYPKTVLACRLAGQAIDGPDIPLQFLLPLGGNRTVRGFPENRFLGRTMLLSTAELRFPLMWRFGAIIGIDAGNVWTSPSDISLASWKTSPAVGLRFSMDTFIVRADLGFSSETTGFYLNFGHIF